MILEVAVLNIKMGMVDEFEESFSKASTILIAMKGYISHELKKCVELSNQFILLVNWETIEDHEIGFRKSEQYKDWKQQLHHYYDPFPKVLHYS